VDYKMQVAKASCEPGISVAKLAQSHGLNTNMVFKWRRQYRAGVLDAPKTKMGRVQTQEANLLPITVLAEPEAHEPASDLPAPSSAAAIEIELNGARVRVIGMVDPLQPRLVLRCLMPA
jgi:transposase